MTSERTLERIVGGALNRGTHFKNIKAPSKLVSSIDKFVKEITKHPQSKMSDAVEFIQKSVPKNHPVSDRQIANVFGLATDNITNVSSYLIHPPKMISNSLRVQQKLMKLPSLKNPNIQVKENLFSRALRKKSENKFFEKHKTFFV